MGSRRKQRNRYALEKYVTILRPKLERQTGGMINMQELGVPESSPPLTDNQLDLVDHPDNVAAERALRPILDEMVQSEGEEHWLYEVLAIAGLRNPDPSSLKRWRTGESRLDRQFLYLFEKALDYVVDRIEELYPTYEMRIALEGDDEPASSLTQSAAQDRWAKQRYQFARSHWLRYEKLLELEERYPEADRQAAKGLWVDRYGMSMSTIRDSIRFCEKHVWADGKPVEEELQWQGEGRRRL